MLACWMDRELKQLTEHADNLVRQAANIEDERDARMKLIGAIQSLTKCVELMGAVLHDPQQ
jgi:hypothetical protein